MLPVDVDNYSFLIGFFLGCSVLVLVYEFLEFIFVRFLKIFYSTKSKFLHLSDSGDEPSEASHK